MQLTAEKLSNPNYIVRVGKEGQHRLDVLHQIYLPSTKDFLIKAGLTQGMKVIDAGCGLGHVSIEIAKIVGPHGKVIAIDDNEEQLQIAKANARTANTNNIDFICASINEISSEIVGNDINFLYGRFILIHMINPTSTLKALYKVLKVGGIMAFEEPDMSSYFAVPPFKAFNKAITWCMECGNAVGLNFDIGNRLYFIMCSLGLEYINFSLKQPLAINQPDKSIISLLTKECRQKYIEYQIAEANEIDLVIEELEKFENLKHTYYGCARQYQVFGKKTNNHMQINPDEQLSLNALIAGKFV